MPWFCVNVCLFVFAVYRFDICVSASGNVSGYREFFACCIIPFCLGPSPLGSRGRPSYQPAKSSLRRAGRLLAISAHGKVECRRIILGPPLSPQRSLHGYACPMAYTPAMPAEAKPTFPKPRKPCHAPHNRNPTVRAKQTSNFRFQHLHGPTATSATSSKSSRRQCASPPAPWTLASTALMSRQSVASAPIQSTPSESRHCPFIKPRTVPTKRILRTTLHPCQLQRKLLHIPAKKSRS
jgi:hypothetical protein